jgi:putative CocE/NonD family hydrolase
MRGRVTLITAAVVLAGFAPGAHAQGPTDYTKIAGISTKRFTDIERKAIDLPSFDGTTLHIDVVKPKAEGRYPVIFHATPYNGRAWLPIPDPVPAERDGDGLVDWFPPRGYAVVTMDLRGTGESRGCVDYMGPNDAADLKYAIEWAAGQSWSNGRVGMTGISYPGSTPITALAQRPKGLETVVPIAGWPGIYHSYFQAGVPFFAHWASTPFVYYAPNAYRKLDDPAGNAQEGECANQNSGATAADDLVTGRFGPWFAARDWTAKAIAAPIPVFAVQGVNDYSVRSDSLEWFNHRNRPGDKIVLGQWGHSYPPREDQWWYELTAWFDRHLAGRDVDTGPATEVYYTGGTIAEAKEGRRDEVLVGDQWPLATQPLTFHPAADGSMTNAPAAAGTKSFAGTTAGFAGPGGDTAPANLVPATPAPMDGAIFVSNPFANDVAVAGFPKMRLSVSVTQPRVNLIATLYDEPPGAAASGRRRLAQFAINPLLRDGLDTVTPTIPGERMDLDPPGFAIAHHFRAGHRLVLRISTSDQDKMPIFAEDPNVTVFTGPGATEVTLPVVAESAIYPDKVPLTAG